MDGCVDGRVMYLFHHWDIQPLYTYQQWKMQKNRAVQSLFHFFNVPVWVATSPLSFTNICHSRLTCHLSWCGDMCMAITQLCHLYSTVKWFGIIRLQVHQHCVCYLTGQSHSKRTTASCRNFLLVRSLSVYTLFTKLEFHVKIARCYDGDAQGSVAHF